MAAESVAAVVLAAGGSTRMGTPKPLLPLRGRTYLEVALGTLAGCPVAPLLVVLGDRAAEVLERVELSGAIALLHRGWRAGMLSSLQSAVRHLREEHPGAAAILVALVDAPLFSGNTVRALLDTFSSTRAPIVLPAYGGRHGHPVLFGAAVWEELLRASAMAGARAVVDAHRHELAVVEVADPWVLRDADTPDEHDALRRDAGTQEAAEKP